MENNLNEEMFGDIPREYETQLKEVETNRDFRKNVKSVSQLLEMESKEVPCIVKGLIIEKAINALTARTAEGKSVFMMRMLKDIAQGSDFLDTYPTKKQRILLLDMEMNESFLIDRVKTIIQDKLNIDIFYESDIDIEKDYANLRDWIKGEGKYEGNGKYDLVVFDTLSFIHSRDENNNTDMTPILKAMIKLINETGCTILYLHHHGKNKEYTGAHLARGATVIIDKASSHLTIQKNTGIESVLSEQKGYYLNIEQCKPRLKDGVKKFGVEVIIDNDKTTFTHKINETDTAETIYASQILTYMKEGEVYCKKELANAISEKLDRKIEPTDTTFERTLKMLLFKELQEESCKEFRVLYGRHPEYQGKPVWGTAKVYWLKDSIITTQLM